MGYKWFKKEMVFATIFFISLMSFIFGANDLIGMITGKRECGLLDLIAMILMVSFPFYIMPLLKFLKKLLTPNQQ